MKQIGVIGLGYVGLITAVFMVQQGFEVWGYDTDETKTKLIFNGVPPFEEPGLDNMLIDSLNYFHKAKNIEEICNKCDIIYICVGTPSAENPEEQNLMYINSVFEELYKYKDNDSIIVIKSTVLPGTTRKIANTYIIENIAHVPEFLAEGSALYNIKYPDKVVVGTDNFKTYNVLKEFYQKIYPEEKILMTNTVNAEMIKYAQNTMLAAKISLMNLFSFIMEEHPGGDIKIVEKALGMDKRISDKFLRAGAGYGGSCFKKDVLALGSILKTLDKKLLINEIDRINEIARLNVVSKAISSASPNSVKKVSVLGLSFKPNTDDMRNAPSIDIIKKLTEIYGEKNIQVYDPAATYNAKKFLPKNIKYCHSIKECLEDSDLAIILTEWDEIKNINPIIFKLYMNNPVVYDARRMYKLEKFKKVGLDYYGTGYGGCE